MNTGYTKLWSSILTSSIWMSDDDTLRVFLFMLAAKDAEGNVRGSVPGSANICRMSVERFLKAEANLLAPDPYSTTPAEEGRRIKRIPGGWYVVNHFLYRDRGQTSTGSRAPYMREWRKRQETPTKKEENATTPPVIPISANPPKASTEQVQENLVRIRNLICDHFKRDRNERWSDIEEHGLLDVAKRPNCFWEFVAIQEFISISEPQYLKGCFKSVCDLLNNWRTALDQAVSAECSTEERFGKPYSERYKAFGFTWTKVDGGPRREQFKIGKAWPNDERCENAFQCARRAYDKWLQQTKSFENGK